MIRKFPLRQICSEQSLLLRRNVEKFPCIEAICCLSLIFQNSANLNLSSMCRSKCSPLIDLINVHEKFNVNARSVILITQMRSQGLTSSQKVNLVKIVTNVLSLSGLRVLLSMTVIFRFYKITFSFQWMHFLSFKLSC